VLREFLIIKQPWSEGLTPSGSLRRTAAHLPLKSKESEVSSVAECTTQGVLIGVFLRGHTRSEREKTFGSLMSALHSHCAMRPAVWECRESSGLLWRYFDEAERRQGVESFFHGAVERLQHDARYWMIW